MCGQHDDKNEEQPRKQSESSLDPPAWEDIHLPADHILKHLTDAHCHPTDLNLDQNCYAENKLGGIAAMATLVEDQDRVKELGGSRPARKDISQDGRKTSGPRVITCFGYHPWFTHRYSLLPNVLSKEDHYTSLFFKPTSKPDSKDRQLLLTLLPYLPDPIPFHPLLDKLRFDIQNSLKVGNQTMLGEIGLDAQARMRWPSDPEAKKLYSSWLGERGKKDDPDDVNDQGEWKRLTPFKMDMKHQRKIVEMQMELAVELGVNVSFHCVAAPGQTLEILTSFRDRHTTRFTNRINVDLHSAGGWTPEFWRNAEKQFLNLYASPSILVTSRVQHSVDLIKAISADRMLVESDSHDVRMMSKWVWGAVEWISAIKEWNVEGKHGRGEDWELDLEDELKVDKKGKYIEEDVWAVSILERNWHRFMQTNQ